MEEHKDGDRLFSLNGQEKMGGNLNKGTPLRHKQKYLYCEDEGALKQVAQKGCDVSILGNFQNLTRHDPEQCALADFTLKKGAGLTGLQRSLPTSAIL